jgi:iron complex outermembrane receptor protein
MQQFIRRWFLNPSAGARWRTLAAALAAWLVATPALAQAPRDLTKATLEDLMDLRITSASRKDQRVWDTAGAVYVITQDDIRRSGLTSVPDLLRLAPGVQVARIDANKWAIAIRGFNSRWSNKLLIMVDGRTVYNRLLSGVYWDMVTVPLQTIDRIEVVRGPGGSVWGANAVDGVINILTSSAYDTPGGTFTAGGGGFGASDAALAFGTSVGHTAVRGAVQALDRGFGLLPGSTVRGGDDSRNVTGGLRIDRTGARTDVTFQSGTSFGQSRTRALSFTGPVAPAGGWAPASVPMDFMDNNLLVQWTRRAGNRSSVRLQTYADHSDRHDTGTHHDVTTVDVDFGYQTTAGRHELVSGAAYRVTADRFDGYFGIHLAQPKERLTVVNLFLQDEMRFDGGRTRLTLGSKIEHDTVSLWALEPTARVLFEISPAQRVWAAVSRAVRTPARIDREAQVIATTFMDATTGMPVAVEYAGNPNLLTEHAVSLEAGYRASIGRTMTVDTAGFWSVHDHLMTVEPQAPELRDDAGQPYLVLPQQFGNNLRTHTTGAETSMHWQPVPRWHLDGSVSLFHLTALPSPTTADPAAALTDGAAPACQWQVRTGVSLGPVDLNAALFSAGALHSRAVPAYTRGDVSFEWRVRPRFSLGIAGQNLVGAGHMEFGGDDNFATPTRSPRTFNAHVTWRF